MRNHTSILVLLSTVILVPFSWCDEPKPHIAQPKRPGLVPLPEFLQEQLADVKTIAKAADELDKAFPGEKKSEAIRMLSAILHGSLMGSGYGWFGPADSRFN